MAYGKYTKWAGEQTQNIGSVWLVHDVVNTWVVHYVVVVLWLVIHMLAVKLCFVWIGWSYLCDVAGTVLNGVVNVACYCVEHVYGCLKVCLCVSRAILCGLCVFLRMCAQCNLDHAVQGHNLVLNGHGHLKSQDQLARRTCIVRAMLPGLAFHAWKWNRSTRDCIAALRLQTGWWLEVLNRTHRGDIHGDMWLWRKISKAFRTWGFDLRPNNSTSCCFSHDSYHLQSVKTTPFCQFDHSTFVSPEQRFQSP